jgi:signal transduction histidine kinase
MPRNTTKLTLPIIAYTAAALLFAAGAILWFVNERASSQAENNAAARAHFIADVLLRDRLTENDFRQSVGAKRRAELDALFARAVRSEGVERINLIGPRGFIAYSTQTNLIGDVPHDSSSHVASSLAGHEVREVETTLIGGRRLKVLETYLPVRTSGESGRPVGVFELYQDYETRVAAPARATIVPVAGFLLLALIVLCATLVPILRRVTVAVEVRNKRLVEQAATLERSLALAHEARTEAESARRALSEQNKRLRELDRLKDEFLSLVSHELRTPLTSIRGYLDLVLEGEAGEINPEQRRFLEAVERNSGRLLRLVGDLLFVAQADAGRLSLERAKVDLAELAAHCVEGAAPAATEKSVSLVLMAEPVPSLVGDRGRLAQVLDNLVSNALKFTPEGGTVKVRTEAEDGQVVLEVEDTGIGIPQADQPRLFERFFRSAVAEDQAIPGTGLGLAIVKAIVEAHSGRISISSREDVGTTFRVELPLAAERGPGERVERAA